MGQVFEEGSFKLTLAKDNIDAYKFDELEEYRNLSSAALKGVDFVIEDKKEVLWVELKNFYNPRMQEKTKPKDSLPNDLCKKYRDTWLFNYLHDDIKKSVKYICVLENMDYALLNVYQDLLEKSIPIGVTPTRPKSILEKGNLYVLNSELWMEYFSHLAHLEVSK